jgi:tripartite-type tricarboxylate transporter receptor subunit TctC
VDYPTQPVRVIVPFAPAGGTDILARLVGQRLSERLHQQFIIENRSGAGANIGVETVVRAPPDGYTLLLVDNSPAINATLYAKLNFNFIRDIAPIASIATQPLVLEANPSFPPKTVPEFMAYARANPGKINFASSGNGGSPHMAGERLKMMAGLDMVHVPYRGTGAALTDLLGGQVQIMFGSLLASIEYIKAGRLHALAVTSASRIEVLPDVPTVGEFVPGYVVSAWYGVGAPRNTPAGIIDKLNTDFNAALADPKIEARIAELGATVFPSSPVDFGKLIAEDTEKWAKVVKASGAKAD